MRDFYSIERKDMNIGNADINSLVNSTIDAVNSKIFSINNIFSLIDSVATYRPRHIKKIYMFCKQLISANHISLNKGAFQNELLCALLVKDQLLNSFMPFKFRKMTTEQLYRSYEEKTIEYALLWDDKDILEYVMEEQQLSPDSNLNNDFTVIDLAAKFGAQDCFTYLYSISPCVTMNTLRKSFIGNDNKIIQTCLKHHKPDTLCIENAVMAHHNSTVAKLIKEYKLNFSWSSCLQYFNMQCFFMKVSVSKNVNMKDFEKNNALIASSLYSNFIAAEFMIKLNADVNETDAMENSPLIISSINNSKEMVELLVRNHANIFQTDAYGRTASENAELKDNQKIGRYLHKIEQQTIGNMVSCS